MKIYFLISIITLAFCFFIFFYFKWYIKKRTSDLELIAEYRSEVYRLIADIDAATDRDSRLVEDRIKKLKTILEETDKRVAVYTRELDRSKTGEALYTSLGRGIRAAINTKPEPPAPEQALPAPVPNLSLFRTDIEFLPQPPPPAAPPKTQSAQTAAKNQIRAKIEELAGEGFSSAQIASRLKISLSEVDLAMNLINRGKKS